MIPEKILNSFLSSHLTKLGLKHINSEVPKVIASHEGERPDILAYDPVLKIPVVLELKVVKSDTVIEQTTDYLGLISKKYPTLFEELEGFGISEIPKFNYDFGIIGMVVSPKEAPTTWDCGSHTIIWVQFGIEFDKLITIKKTTLLNNSNENAKYFGSANKVKPLMAGELLKLRSPNLRIFVNELHNELMKCAPIYVRPKPEYGYAAYYGMDTLGKAVFGIASSGGTSFSVDYHVKTKNHKAFLLSQPVIELSKLGYSFSHPRKDLIFQLPINDEEILQAQHKNLLMKLFIETAKIVYDLARDTIVDNLILDEISYGKLSLKDILK